MDELVDYLLFVDEAPLGTIKGNAGFAEWFSAQGPKDPAGRSLRELKLDGRLLRYPLSYMVYSRAFEALPPPIKTAVYDRLWTVLSGGDAAPKYAAPHPRRPAGHRRDPARHQARPARAPSSRPLPPLSGYT